MVRAVLFDLDGTLLNRDASLRDFVAHQHARLNRFLSHIPLDEYVQRFLQLDSDGRVWKDKVYQSLVEEFTIEGMEWPSLLQDYWDHFHNHCIPFPNLDVTLATLQAQGIRLGMITNGYGEFQTRSIRALGIHHYFDAVLISEWEGVRKPDPEIFTRALERLEVSASESVFVGDHLEHDVVAAKNAGLKAIWKRNAPGHPRTEVAGNEADGVIDDLADILLHVKS